ncbi:hypothetical protein BK133_01095 [Paenibacillus sp. FSL H8-0548]|uniref:DUF2225 domain-containing protein n=1 Tax=Paenibacillus sp. FSL H8-0548 TaxID=1920422 RepID=UPI00096CFF3E|nr:DUF2225 domain-containing protein [Paenibacillus sp. FSL H8-0548]OMF38829.1 hypothetical protein BK133_01095 [Paenibacillus sp. FSL H8-0548]
MEPLYQSKIECICCEKIFMTSRVRPSFKRAVNSDTDFCGYYKAEVNPDFYVVRVCPNCGFASTENGIGQLNDLQKKKFFDEVGFRWNHQDYCGERNEAMAMASYKLALFSAQLIGEKDRVIAGILHHIAWLYRYKGNHDEEVKFLRFALQAYIRVYEAEGVSLNNAKLMYLIGELNRRIGELNEAVRWFSRVVNDKKIVDAAMIRASREQWQFIRQGIEARSEQASGNISQNDSLTLVAEKVSTSA